jgi:hypothetical protein
MLPVSLDCFCFVCIRLVHLMLPVSLDWFCVVCIRRRIQPTQKQSRETGNIGYTRRIQTTQKQSRETGNIGYTRRIQTTQKQSRETCVFYVASFSGLFLRCLYSSCASYAASFSGLFLCLCIRLVYPMLSVSLDCFCVVTKQKQSRETGNIGYTRGIQTAQNNPEKLTT